MGQDGKVEKYKCRLVAQRVLVGGRCTLHGKVLAHAATASILMLLAMAAAEDGELRHFDAEQAFFRRILMKKYTLRSPRSSRSFRGQWDG